MRVKGQIPQHKKTRPDAQEGDCQNDRRGGPFPQAHGDPNRPCKDSEPGHLIAQSLREPPELPPCRYPRALRRVSQSERQCPVIRAGQNPPEPLQGIRIPPVESGRPPGADIKEGVYRQSCQGAQDDGRYGSSFAGRFSQVSDPQRREKKKDRLVVPKTPPHE